MVNSQGTVTGDTVLSSGNDTILLSGGSYTGNILSDSGDDTFIWTDGTLTGGFYGGAGSDTAIVSAAAYDGTQILDGGDDTSMADGMSDTLRLLGVSASSTGGNLVNWERVSLEGSSLSITDGAWKVGEASENDTGVFLTHGSTLNAMSSLAYDGRLHIDNSSTLVARGGGSGVYAISGDLNHAGILTLQDGQAGDVLNVGQNYVGANGNVHIDTVLGNDSSRTDRLIIGGDTFGSTHLWVNNVDGTGAPTAEGIRIIDVAGVSAGKFTLKGDYEVNNQPAIVGGAYAYQLYQGGTSTPNDGHWYLRSELKSSGSSETGPLYQAGVPSYEVYPRALLALNGLPTLQQRVGNRYWAGAGNQLAQPADTGDAAVTVEGNGVWGRIEGAHHHMKPHVSTSNTSFNQDVFKLELGVDKLLSDSEDGTLIAGLNAHYVHGKTDTRSPHGNGEIRTDGFGYAASVESGKRIALNKSLSITPQAQLMYSNVDFDSFTDAFDARVSHSHGHSLQGRLGISLDHESSRVNVHGTPIRTHVYGIANLYYEFMNATTVKVANTHFNSRSDRLWAGLGVGGSYNWNKDKYSLYGEASVNTSLNRFADNYSVIARIGVRVRW